MNWITLISVDGDIVLGRSSVLGVFFNKNIINLFSSYYNPITTQHTVPLRGLVMYRGFE